MILAAVAAAIAEALDTHDIVYVTDDEQQAEALALALTAIVPNPVIHLPSSDALPGDKAPPSPSNTGRRVAALQGLRRVQTDTERHRLALILSGEAAARRYAPPDAFDNAPPTLAVGDPIDVAAFTEQVEGIGYFSDDRVDEPGEVAVRGDVIDIFPADAGTPVRIEVADGRIAALRSYDPATQRTIEERDRLEIGRAADPQVTDAVPILAHLAPGVIGMAAEADARRKRFVALATDAAARTRATPDAIDDAAWTRALDGWEQRPFANDAEPVPRFVEQRAPFATAARFAQPLLDEGRALLLAGSERDIRFLRPRLAKRLKLDVATLGSWHEAAALAPGGAATLAMPADGGYVDEHRVVITAGDLLGSRASLETRPRGLTDPLALIGSDIRVGDVAVHQDHGVGVVAGLETAPNEEGEMIVLEYAAEVRRLVPIDEAGRIWRYGADADAVTLDKLDGSTWQKRRGEIDAAIAESARGLTRSPPRARSWKRRRWNPTPPRTSASPRGSRSTRPPTRHAPSPRSATISPAASRWIA